MSALWSQAAIGVLGVLHAAAAFSYFSKARFAAAWAAAWIALAAWCAWWLPAQPLLSAGMFGAAVALWTGWWIAIRAMPGRVWVADNARQATGRIAGSELRIRNRRNFEWRGKLDYTPRWDDAVYDIDALEAVDLFVSTWADPRMAHLIVSFVFGGHATLAFSIETRRETTEKWSGLAGLMKAYELIIIAAPESDLIRLRTNIRGETVRRYRLRLTPAMRRKLLRQYLREMNRLARQPRFYNTLLSNCTTEVARILRAAGRRVPFSWALIVSGYVPRYFHQVGLIDNEQPFAQIEAAADIGERARDDTSRVEFSARIRAPR